MCFAKFCDNTSHTWLMSYVCNVDAYSFFYSYALMLTFLSVMLTLLSQFNAIPLMLMYYTCNIGTVILIIIFSTVMLYIFYGNTHAYLCVYALGEYLDIRVHFKSNHRKYLRKKNVFRVIWWFWGSQPSKKYSKIVYNLIKESEKNLKHRKKLPTSAFCLLLFGEVLQKKNKVSITNHEYRHDHRQIKMITE